MSNNRRRFIAEWEPTEAVIITLPAPHTDWDYILDEAIDQYRALAKAIASTGVKLIVLCADSREAAELLALPEGSGEVFFIETDFNDTWVRDYGPLCIEKDGDRRRALDFGFNAWGLKFAADKDNTVNRSLAEKGIIRKEVYRNDTDFVLEGGSVETDGAGTVLTTTRCLCSPNRNGFLSKAEVNAQLQRRLGADYVVWLDFGALEGDDTDSHIDTLARMAPDDTIIYTGCDDPDDPQFAELALMKRQLSMVRTAEGNPFNLIELPIPDPVYDPADGSRLPATYANYLIVNNFILMPTYGCGRKDLLAAKTLKIAFPGHEIISVDCRTLLRQHGSLHCATMQIPEGIAGL